MITSQYERLDVHVMAPDIAVIRKARATLSELGKSPSMRAHRKSWYRAILAEHHAARQLYLDFRF